jgi:heme/copper-type cytochrome/quinol oxidase subunit 4
LKKSIKINQLNSKTKNMFCQKCGKENGDNNKFCIGCGNALPIEKVIAPNNSTPTTSQPINLNNNQQPAKKVDYYQNNSSKKILDFLIAFFGIEIITSLPLAFFIFVPPTSITDAETTSILFLFSFIRFAIQLFFIIYFFKKGRRFIAIGILASTISPLFFTGACAIFLNAVLSY